VSVFGQDTLKARRTLEAAGKKYDYYSLEAAANSAGFGDLSRLPVSLKVLLENLLRWEDGRTVTTEDVEAVANWLKDRRSTHEIAYRPARILLQDMTGVPAVVDLASMRDAMVELGGDPAKINPLAPVDLVVDHSVMIDYYGTPDALEKNIDLEFERNTERYEFLRWGATAFDNFRVIPPGSGICHQVNVEYLAKTVFTADDGGTTVAYPDSCVGTDSHTTMVSGLAVLGWGVGGIEAEACMLGQPISMLIPEVVGFKLTGKMKEGTTATDLVLNVVQMLRELGVVSKFVEFYGPGLDNLALPDRATIANMAPEYGATIGFFPVDKETIRYLTLTGRDDDQVALVEAYAKANGMWRDADTPDPVFTDTLELDISTVEPCISGPKRPQDKIQLSESSASFDKILSDLAGISETRSVAVKGADHELRDGDVVIAAITSCTNTSNPSVLMGAGLLARNAVKKGLQSKPWVKTSLAPGSQVVADYLEGAGLQDDLDALGFNIAGFGCTTCIGNSGPLNEPISDAITEGDLVATAVLSGNRNFEGRISPFVKANFLASPPLVVAYALAGSLTRDLYNDPLGKDSEGNPVFLKDIWPTDQEIQETIARVITPEMFRARYDNVLEGSDRWKSIPTPTGLTYKWNPGSTYVQHPPFFESGDGGAAGTMKDVVGARPLAILADSVTTDHISPAGGIAPDGPAANYLLEHQVRPHEFNSFGSRRGNHQVMMRGTLANIRIKNEVAPGTEGGVTRFMPSGDPMTMYDAAVKYQAEGTPLVIIGGKEYGSGSSRDWAAKGTRLLGVKAVIVESFERIHRSNLLGMGVLPLEFKNGEGRKSLKLDGTETYDVTGFEGGITPGMDIAVKINRADGSSEETTVRCRIDTLDEVEYYKSGGILPYVLGNLHAA
jgi:aconitate hydratase